MSDVELVKSRVNIVDIVGEYVKLVKVGSSFKACCPFHQEKTPSFVVSEERQTYHCFGCNQGGDVLTFLMEMEAIGFREALKMLAEKTGIELQDNFSSNKQEKENKDKFYSILNSATQFFQENLYKTENSQVLNYLLERGLTKEIIQKFKIGFVPEGWQNLEHFLTQQNFSSNDIFSAGLLIKKENGGFYDRFRNRIIYPIADSLGRIVGFTARILPWQNQDQAKYINTPESPLYHKSSILYGIDLAKQSIKQKDQAVILEGNMDVIASWQAGVENVVAVSGTALTEEHIKILKRWTKNFILFFDSDKAGLEALKRSAKICLLADINLSAVILKSGKDASDIVKDNPEKLPEIIAQAKDVISTLIELIQSQFNLNNPREKRTAIEEISVFLSHIVNSIEREAWVSKCADIFQTDEKTIFEIVEKERAEKNRVFSSQNSVNFSTNSSSKNNNLSTKRESEISQEIKNSRLYRLYKLVALILLAFPEVWQYVSDNKYKFEILLEHNFLKNLIQSGVECNFQAENFVNQDFSRENIYKESLNFRQRFEVESSGTVPMVEFENYFKNLLEEKNKQEQEDLLKQLKKAEKVGNLEEQKRLLEKINEVSKKVA